MAQQASGRTLSFAVHSNPKPLDTWQGIVGGFNIGEGTMIIISRFLLHPAECPVKPQSNTISTHGRRRNAKPFERVLGDCVRLGDSPTVEFGFLPEPV